MRQNGGRWLCCAAGRGWDIFVPLCRRESFNGPLCADCFMVQNPCSRRTSLFLLYFFQSLGSSPAQFDRAMAVSAYNRCDFLFNRRDVLERLPAMAENAGAGGKTGERSCVLLPACVVQLWESDAIGCFHRTPGNMGMEIGRACCGWFRMGNPAACGAWNRIFSFRKDCGRNSIP